MNASSPAAVASEEARLYQELAQLAADLCARFPDADESRVDAYVQRRGELVDRIRVLGVEGAAEPVEPGPLEASWHQSQAAMRQILDLDRDLVRLLEARKARIGHELQRLQQWRGTLESYRGRPPRTPSHLDRLG